MKARFFPFFAFVLSVFVSVAFASEAPVVPVLVWRGEEIVRLERAEEPELNGVDWAAAAMRAQLRELAEYETELGLEPFFGRGAALESFAVSGEGAIAEVRLAGTVWEKGNAVARERFSWVLEEWGQSAGIETISVRVTNAEGAEIAWIESGSAPQISKPEPPELAMEELAMAPMHAPAQGTAQPMGALSDASIFLAPGHGWHYSTNVGRWATQRGNNYQIIEDLNSGESVLQYLHQYLWNAGARIYTSRERDLNTNMVIVDQGGPGYSQSGSWVAQNLSGTYGGGLRYATTVTGAATATARFTPNIPEAGYYAVYVWYRTASGGTTTQDAKITIHHTGDSTLWVQDQNRDGFTWKYVGTYYFEKGSNPETGSVTIDNRSAVAGRRVIAGAVRFGGGMGDMVDPAGGTVSGKPRWEESGLYYAGFLGKSDWASSGTVNAMPRWAAWEHESWESGKSVYVAWHTNAAGGTGTETFAFSNRSDSAFNGVAGGDRLRNYLQDQIIRDARAAWKSNWADRGKKTANFGELNPSNNNKMPAALIEMAFHDREEDAKYLLDPQFRRDMARAVYKALVQFYANELPDFNNATYLPEPPRNFRVTGNANGTVQLSWIPPVFSTGATGLYGHQATGYRIYRSKNGYGFDNGTPVSGTGTTLSGFTPGEVVYFRVSATNAGGESFPTSTLAVRIPEENSKKVLLVNGFTRNDRFMNVIEDDPYSANPLQRGYVGKLNTYNYAIQHAEAIAAYPELIGVDSAEVAAVEGGQALLGNYDAVIWMAGLQAQVNDIGNPILQTPAFTSTGRSRIAQYVNGGGQLFVSGAEVAWDSDRAGAGAWLRDVLKSGYVRRSAMAELATGLPGSFLPEWSGTFNMAGGGSGYRVDNPNVILPTGGSVAAMRYTGSGRMTVDGFETVTGWWQPRGSGSTTGDGTFSAVANPVRDGNGAARLEYVWGAGNFIRIHKPSQTQFSPDSNFSIWVYGDNSGHQFRVSVRDSDGELYATAYRTIDFSGWREIVWENLRNNVTRWAGTGDGVVGGQTVGLESLQVSRTTGGPGSGTIYFDYASITPLTAAGGERVAAVQYDGNYRLFYMAFPFESIQEPEKRAELMAAALDFFGMGLTPFEEWQKAHFTEAQLADPEVSGDQASPAGDGIPNLLKYATGLDPWESGTADLPRVAVVEGRLQLTYRESKAATDVNFVVEISEDLVNWRNASAETEIAGEFDEGETRRITVRELTSVSEEGRRFLRLRVERE